MRRSRTALLALTSVLVLGAVACGDDEDIAETGTTTTTEAPEETTTTAAPEEDAPEVTRIEVTAVDYGFEVDEGALALEPGLVQVDLTNTGTEEHQAALVRLNDGVTGDQFFAEATADPTGVAAFGLIEGYGGPNAAAPEGGTSSSTQSLTAGEYLMICFIPSPSDGIPHAAKGMVVPFTVEGDAEPAALPDGEVDGDLELVDFGFEVPVDFNGSGTFAVVNNGEQQHELVVYSLAEGSTIDDALEALAGTATGPPPITPVTGVVAVAPGVDAYLPLDLAPGEYAFLCFLPDTAGSGAPHFTLGMAAQISIA